MRAGGAIGEVLAGLLVTDFNRTGAYIVAATGLFVALILSTQFSFSAFLQGGVGRVGARLRTLQTAFTHYRETRRKEKMRREVIRKHAISREEAAGLPKIRRVKSANEGEPEAEIAAEPEDDLPLQASEPPARPAQKQLPFLAASPRASRADRSRTGAAPEAKAARAVRKTALRWRARRAAATRCPRSPSSTRPKVAHSSTTTACSSAARSCR